MGVGQTELQLVQVTSMTSIATNFSRSPHLTIWTSSETSCWVFKTHKIRINHTINAALNINIS